MATYLYPEARELREIGPELVTNITANDVTFRIMPIREVDAALIQWSVEDDDLGLQQLRGLDGAPLGVQPLGKGSFVSEPGYFGEFETITERELTLRGGSVIGDAVINIGDLVTTKFRQLVSREMTRIRQIIWTLLSTGTFSVAGKGSTLTFTDTFAVQTFASGVAWATVATATPLADLRAVQQLGSARGVDFGARSLAVMNRVTANRMFNNTNAADLGGRRTIGGGTVNSLSEVNRFAMGEDLPEIVIYDAGYKNDSGTFTKFIADGKVVVVGIRMDGDSIGEYRMTRNLNNPDGSPGSYEYIKDYIRGINAPKMTPPKIEVHRGHNGGPLLTRASAIVVMTV